MSAFVITGYMTPARCAICGKKKYLLDTNSMEKILSPQQEIHMRPPMYQLPSSHTAGAQPVMTPPIYQSSLNCTPSNQPTKGLFGNDDSFSKLCGTSLNFKKNPNDLKMSLHHAVNSGMFIRDLDGTSICICGAIVRGVNIDDYIDITMLSNDELSRIIPSNAHVATRFSIKGESIGAEFIKSFIDKHFPIYKNHCENYYITQIYSQNYCVIVVVKDSLSKELSLNAQQFNFAMKMISNGTLSAISSEEDIAAIKLGNIVSQFIDDFDNNSLIYQRAHVISNTFCRWYTQSQLKNIASKDSDTDNQKEDDPNDVDLVDYDDDCDDDYGYDNDADYEDESEDDDEEEEDDTDDVVYKKYPGLVTLTNSTICVEDYIISMIDSAYMQNHKDLFNSDHYYLCFTYYPNKTNKLTESKFINDMNRIFGVHDILESFEIDVLMNTTNSVSVIAEFRYPDNVTNWHLKHILKWYEEALRSKKHPKSTDLVDYIKLSGCNLECYLAYYEDRTDLREALFKDITDEQSKNKIIYNRAYRFRAGLRKLLNDPTK